MTEWRILCGDAAECADHLPQSSAQTVVTSPPYFGLRDYGDGRQIGIEATPSEYVSRLVDVFRAVRNVLKPDGTLWLNLGDTYRDGNLLGIPWRVALALVDDGWVLRSEIIWAKRNGLPDGSATDRPDRFHEHIFLLARQRRYYYDADSIREDSDPKQEAHNRLYAREYAVTSEKAPTRQPGNVNHVGIHARPGPGGRNKRSVWTTSVARYVGAHTAVFPPELIEPCVVAGAPEGGVVLDPFCGTGTTGVVALRRGRSFVGIELNGESVALARRRIIDDSPLLNSYAEVAA